MALKITDEQNYQDIADAIRGKLGSSDTFLPSEMADAIERIPSGGETEEIKTIFIDYDGTVLHSYTQDEVDALTELPELPAHIGLICQGWNWTLSELQSFGRAAVVGANYVTDDGKTRVYVSIPENDRYVKTHVTASTTFNATVDWGDGTSSEITRADSTAEHIYAQAGDYVVTFTVNEGVLTFNGTSSIGSRIIFSNQGSIGPIGAVRYINKIELGRSIAVSTYAFANASNLKSITVPNNIVFKDGDLYQCNNLKSVVFPASSVEMPVNCMFGCVNMKYVSLPPTVTTIKSSFASDCNNLERITLPEGLTQILTEAFLNCYSLIISDIPNSLTSIGNYSFEYVPGLPKKLIFSENVTKLGRSCFAYTNIEEVEINGDVSVGSAMFSNNRSLKKVKIRGTISGTSGSMFLACSELEEIHVLGDNTEIPANFASGCHSLKKAILTDSITAFGDSAFEDCMSLNEINMPEGLLTFGDSVFYGCWQVDSMVIPQGVTVIPSYCFAEAFSLTNIIFLGDIQKIESYAFTKTGGLTDVDLTHCTAVPILKNANAFVAIENRLKIKVPSALYADWIVATNWSTFEDYIVAI